MIRAAESGEVASVRAVVLAAYQHYVARIGKPPGPMLDDYARRITDGQTWVMQQVDGRIAGVLVLEEQAEGLLLDNIAVLPECQGQGVGRALLRFAEVEAGRRGYRQIRLYTHALMTENIALYGRIGYVETGRVREKGFDRVYMAKPLPDC
jgi:ribosomal protein S18 acetylase RimI-like enzyme